MLHDKHITERVQSFIELVKRLDKHHEIDGIAVLYIKLPIKLQLHLKKLGADETRLPDISLFRYN
jgi:hypothetical protein